MMQAAGLSGVRRVECARAEESSSSETNGTHRTRARNIPKLIPLLAVGTVPAAGGKRRRRSK